MRRIAVLAAASLLSLSVSLPTFAYESYKPSHGTAQTPLQTPVQKHLSTYRDDTHALMTLKIDLQTWKNLFDEAMSSVNKAKKTATQVKEELEKSSENEVAEDAAEDAEAVDSQEVDSSEDLLKVFNEFNQEMKDQTGVDLFWDVLLNMGTHLSAGYRAFPNRAGDLLFQLDVRSGAKASEVLDKVYTTLQAEGDNTRFIKEKFGPKTLYTFVLEEDEPVYQRLSIAVHDNTLIATLGPDAHQLKTMLYLGQVHPKDSAFRLTSTPYFKPVEKALHHNPLWLYSDLQSVTDLARLVGDEFRLESSDLDLLADIVPLVRGVGLGVDYKRNQLSFQGIAAHDMANLSDFHKAYLNTLKAPSESKSAVMNRLLGPSPFVFVGEKLGLALDKPFPLDPEKMARSTLFSSLEDMSYRKLLPQFLSLDLDQDVLPYIDGNYGFSVVEIPGKETPQSVLVLGLKQGQGKGFEKVLQDKLNIDLKELMSDDEAPPIRLVPHGDYAGVSTYRFSGPLDDGDAELKEIVFPVAAQTGDVFIIGQTEAALKAALDRQDFRNPAITAWMQKTDTRQAANVFLMDIAQLIDWATRYGLVDKENEDLQVLGKSLRSIYSATYPSDAGFEGKLVLDVDLGSLPIEKLTELFAGEFDESIEVDVEEAPILMDDDTSDEMDEESEFVEDASEEEADEDSESEEDTSEEDLEDVSEDE